MLKAMQAEAHRRREAAEAGSPVPQEESLITSPGVAEAMAALEAARARMPDAWRSGERTPAPPTPSPAPSPAPPQPPAPAPAPSPGSSGEGLTTTAEIAAYLLRHHEAGQARRAREAVEAAAAPSSTPSPPPSAPGPSPRSTPPPPSTPTSTPASTEATQSHVDPDVDPGVDAAPDAATRGVAMLVRLHPGERETWHQAARAAGYGKTAWWVRDVMNAVAAGERTDPARPTPAPAARVLPLEVQRTLTGIGTNLNQLARRANGEAREGVPGTVSDAEVDRAREAMDRLTLALKDALG